MAHSLVLSVGNSLTRSSARLLARATSGARPRFEAHHATVATLRNCTPTVALVSGGSQRFVSLCAVKPCPYPAWVPLAGRARRLRRFYSANSIEEFRQVLLSALESELKGEGEGEEAKDGLREKQLELVRRLCSDVSEPTKELISKLNCDFQLSGEELYQVGVAMFQVREQVGPHTLEMVVPIFECAGELGDLNALYTFAQLLRTGQGCSADAKRSALIFTDLAMKGHPYAQFSLAGMFYSGIGVKQNFKRAFTLYQVSAKNLVPQAFNILGEMHRHGQGVEENIDEAIKCYELGAEMNDPFAHLSLAHCYTHGKGKTQSYERAFEHHLKASESGNPVALYNVGGHYFAGKGVALCFNTAAEYYTKAADMGFAPAQVNLGNMYYNGIGVAKSRSRAKELYLMAADRDDNAKALFKEVELEEDKERRGEGEGEGDGKTR